jgi:hypothetical protein
MLPTPRNYCGADDATVVYGPGMAQPSQIALQPMRVERASDWLRLDKVHVYLNT